MKWIINNKKYDTDTAFLRVELKDRYGIACERLYQKTNGEFFLVKLHYCFDEYEVYPLTEHDARNWAEENITVDRYESIFGKVEE